MTFVKAIKLLVVSIVAAGLLAGAARGADEGRPAEYQHPHAHASTCSSLCRPYGAHREPVTDSPG